MARSRKRQWLLGGAGMLGALALGAAPASAEKTKLNMIFWTFQAEAVQRFVDEFMRRNPDIEVTLDGAPSGEYNAKAALMLRSRAPVDVLYIRDATLPQWVENNWVQPIDDCPGVKDTIADIIPFARDAQSYGGRLYGLTYYSGILPIIVNTRMMREAGFKEPPKSFEGWIEQARAVKKKDIVDYPMSWPIKQSGWGGMYVWATMAAAKGGKLFDADMNVTPEGVAALKWWRQTFEEGLSNPANIGWDNADVANAFMDGKTFMQWNQQLYAGAQFANHPQKSKVKGEAKIVSPPGTGAMVGFTAMYGITAATKHKEAACKLVTFLGGKDEKGVYNTPRAWVEAASLTWGQRSVKDDPAVRASLAAWGASADEFATYLDNAVAMAEAIPFFRATWYFEWQESGDKLIQEVLGGRVTPEEGMAKMVERAKQLARRHQRR